MVKVLFKANSYNRKIGADTACTYTEKSTCPDACELKNNGCYADGYPVSFHWHGLSNPEKKTKSHFDWEDFLLELKKLPKGKLFRHNVAGDLPGENNVINRGKLDELVNACKKINGFTFTHKPVGWGAIGESPWSMQIRASNTEAIKDANNRGFTINLSADSLEQADYLASLNIGPVVSVVPMDYPRHSNTPEGRHVIVCPNEEDKNITCAQCKLCAKPNRKAIVAFRAHGFKKHKISKRLTNKSKETGQLHLSVL